MQPDPAPLSAEYRSDVVVGILLSLVTCGLYNIYWNYLEMKALNELLGRREYVFWRWALFTLITCGLYHVYYEYKMGSDLYEYLKAKGYPANSNLPLIGLLLSLLGGTIIADAVYQHEINKLTR